MADWAALHFRARAHAATEPGFLAARHLELVTLSGGHLGYCLHIGIDLATPAGRNSANFHAALIMFCWELCSRGVGHVPYNPAPMNLGPVGPIAVGPAGGVPGDAPGGQGGAPPPDVDHDFVEVIGGVHPVHGPWAVDNDFVEIIGGVDPVHGPWVEGGPPVGFGGLLPEDIQLIDQMWEEAFGQEAINQNGEDDQENAPVQ
jgi:hypothetical protein